MGALKKYLIRCEGGLVILESREVAEKALATCKAKGREEQRFFKCRFGNHYHLTRSKHNPDMMELR